MRRVEGFERVSKGSLWHRGISLAEAEIEGGLEASGRWRGLGSGDRERPALELAEEAVSAVAEESGFASMAA